MKGAVVVLAIAGVLGCNRGEIQNKEAVRQAVVDYLASRKGLNVNSMNVDVTSVSFQQDQADVTVSFSPKGQAAPGQNMSMRYSLERQGSHWVVKNRADSGGNPHGTGAMPAEPGSAAEGGSMPPGHPPVAPKPSKPLAPDEKK